MTDVEKLILQKLDSLSGEMKEVRTLAENTQAELKEVRTLAENTQAELKEVRAFAEDTRDELKDELNEVRTLAENTKEELDKVRELAVGTKILLENETNRKISLIGEGYDYLREKLENMLFMTRRCDRMEIEIVDLRTQVKEVKRHLNLA